MSKNSFYSFCWFVLWTNVLHLNLLFFHSSHSKFFEWTTFRANLLLGNPPIRSLLYPFLPRMGCICLLFEASTPPLCMRTILKIFGRGKTRLFDQASLWFGVLFFIARILIGVPASALWWNDMLIYIFLSYVFYSILIQLWTKMFRGCIASSFGRFFFHSYSNLIQNTPLAALPPPVAAPYSILVQVWS